MVRIDRWSGAALLGALALSAVLATPVSAQVRPPAYGEGPGATGGNVPVRQLPNTGSGPGDADADLAPISLVVAAIGAGGAAALGASAWRRRRRRGI